MNTLNKLLVMTGVICAAAVATVPAWARSEGAADPAKASDVLIAAVSADDLAEGEIRKIDKEQGKITLKHGPIKNLDMPPMTMVFAVKDKAMLDSIKPGDRVRFRAEDANGKITVVEMQPAK